MVDCMQNIHSHHLLGILEGSLREQHILCVCRDRGPRSPTSSSGRVLLCMCSCDETSVFARLKECLRERERECVCVGEAEWADYKLWLTSCLASPPVMTELLFDLQCHSGT